LARCRKVTHSDILIAGVPQGGRSGSPKNLNKSRPALYNDLNGGMSQSDRAGLNPIVCVD
jgi:hypothetical protein